MDLMDISDNMLHILMLQHVNGINHVRREFERRNLGVVVHRLADMEIGVTLPPLGVVGQAQ